MPTGGVTLETAADFLKAGALRWASAARSLVRAVADGDFQSIERLARQFVEVVARARA